VIVITAGFPRIAHSHRRNLREETMRNAMGPGVRALLVVLVTLATIKVASQEKKPEIQDVPKYDASNPFTLDGKVREVKEYQCPISGTVGTHLTVVSREGGGLVEVHAAPASFMKQYSMVIRPGDEVRVVGMKTMFGGKVAMLAKTVAVTRTLGKETYTDEYAFRDDKGRPLW
jgi:DNA/RNA endonuclease YhcR with UshA esterase domain